MISGSAIINTSSVTAYQGNKQLIDYSSTKGAIVAFTLALSSSIVERGIRVNAVATRSDLDTPHPRHVSPGESREVRRRRADETARPARGDRALLRLSRLGRLFLHLRASSPSQWRHGRQRLTTYHEKSITQVSTSSARAISDHPEAIPRTFAMEPPPRPNQGTINHERRGFSRQRRHPARSGVRPQDPGANGRDRAPHRERDLRYRLAFRSRQANFVVGADSTASSLRLALAFLLAAILLPLLFRSRGEGSSTLAGGGDPSRFSSSSMRL